MSNFSRWFRGLFKKRHHPSIQGVQSKMVAGAPQLPSDMQTRVSRAAADIDGLYDLKPALPHEMMHGDVAEVRIKDGRYEILINATYIDVHDALVKAAVSRAASYIVCDLIAKNIGVAELELPRQGLPSPGDGYNHPLIAMAKDME